MIKLPSGKKKLPGKFFVFVASAHPPNLTGLVANLENTNNLFLEEFKIVIVGSISSLLDSFPKKNDIFPDSRFIILGVVDDKDLDAILSCAHCILIPITTGGGSNLKTAEALLSGKFVISTMKGMRGFERYINAPGVYVSENSFDFQRNMLNIWDLPSPNFEASRNDDLTWDFTVKPLLRELGI